MDSSKNVPSDNQNANLVSPSTPPSASYLTRDQEHEIMVLALRQVISNTGGDTPSSSSIPDNVLPPLDAGPCILCGVIGCYGCAFQQRHEKNQEIKKEKKHKGVRKRPSGKWSAEIWDPSLKMRKWLGTFPTMEMAGHAYDEAAAKLVGRISARDGKKNGE